MPLIECKDCGAKVSDAAPACIRCGCPITKPTVTSAEPRRLAEGFSAPATVPTAPGLPMLHTAPSFVCGYCQSTDVKVLPLVVADGTQTINTTTGTVGLGYGGGTIGIGGASSTTKGVSQSELAQLVAKPKPQEADHTKSAAGCLFFVVTFIFVASSDMPEGGGLVLIIVGLLVVIATQAKERAAKARVNAIDYPPKLAKWQRSYLCMRCMRVTDPKAS